MNKKNIVLKDKNLNNKIDKKALENKVIEHSLNTKIEYNIIDSANTYYSERYGWTLRKN